MHVRHVSGQLEPWSPGAHLNHGWFYHVWEFFSVHFGQPGRSPGAMTHIRSSDGSPEAPAEQRRSVQVTSDVISGFPESDVLFPTTRVVFAGSNVKRVGQGLRGSRARVAGEVGLHFTLGFHDPCQDASRHHVEQLLAWYRSFVLYSLWDQFRLKDCSRN